MRNSYPISIDVLFNNINNSNPTSLEKLQLRAVELLILNRKVIELLPVTLRPWCRVANLRNNIIVLETANASWMMRLRYEQTQLVYTIRAKILPSLSSIDIKIKPSLAIIGKLPIKHNNSSLLPSNKILKQKPRILSLQSAKLIRHVAAHSEGKLQSLLERLAKLARDSTDLTYHSSNNCF
ncbi:DUF721 domain-containing protein [Candidatus Palibaumannia cicadellinicola]|uniref:Zn-ribbon-containing, possibly RNA-binding protein n=1 Tax=Candidatus Palibaumannia cicadellinicola TaxID=186490 RepID=A0A088MYJ2_9GAMM|nr:DciA family protein [Candidatus Baumannia cicadellinicola]AIN47430.1 Zn-ribbon-containing, possibly RNA-binding protein [Candidatus Baumannia cicadellinicola]